MNQSRIHQTFQSLRNIFPFWLLNLLRKSIAGILTPVLFSHQTGHFKSCLKGKSTSKDNKPLPWYSYPCIDFLKLKNFEEKTILEFGGGQSTLWWSERAKHIITFESDKNWYERIKSYKLKNVDVFFISDESSAIFIEQVSSILEKYFFPKFDVVINDGPWRGSLISLAINLTKENGVIIYDDTENTNGFPIWEEFANHVFSRIDFIGHAPCVISQHCTSIFFRPTSTLFSSESPFPKW